MVAGLEDPGEVGGEPPGSGFCSPRPYFENLRKVPEEVIKCHIFRGELEAPGSQLSAQKMSTSSPTHPGPLFLPVSSCLAAVFAEGVFDCRIMSTDIKFHFHVFQAVKVLFIYQGQYTHASAVFTANMYEFLLRNFPVMMKCRENAGSENQTFSRRHQEGWVPRRVLSLNPDSVCGLE